MNCSTWRSRVLTRLIVRLQVRSLSVSGLERLAFAGDGGFVVATTHITDMDMPIAWRVLGDRYRLRAANMSLHHSFLTNIPMNFLLHIAGKANFHPIDYREGTPARGTFNPANYPPMADALTAGDVVMIAAHRPMSQPHLPPHGGVGAVYLAGIADVPIVPLAVTVRTDGSRAYTNTVIRTMFDRPEARVVIGEPFRLGPLAAAEVVTPELTAELRNRSEVLMGRIRQLV